MTAVFLSGCGGSGGGGGNQITNVGGTANAVLVGINNPSREAFPGGQGPALPGQPGLPGIAFIDVDYSQVAIHVTFTSPLPPSEIIEYHVYRSDFLTDPSITATGGEVPGQVPVYTQTASGSLDFWDDGTDRAVNYQTVNPDTGKLVTVKSTGDLPIVIGTGIKTSLTGKRFTYSVEVLGKVNNKYFLSKKVVTNTVTYLQPALLTYGSFTGVSPDRVNLTVGATLGADDYILELSSRPDFADKKTIKPFNPSLIQLTSASQLTPRRGAQFQYFNPDTGVDMTTVFPGAPIIYARMGIRDSGDGVSTASNPYLYSGTTQVPSF